MGVVAWIDALRLGLTATPRPGIVELAALASKDGRWLLPPVLATATIAALAAAIRRARSADREPGAPPSRGVAWPVLAGWAAGLAFLAGSGFSLRLGWPAGALLLGLASAFLAGRVRKSRSSAPHGWVSLLAAGLLWLPVLLLPGLSAAAPAGITPPGAGAQPSFILVVIDALRADHLGIYGHARETSPNLDRLARSGVLFTRAVSPSSWTPPSMASLLTSSTVGQHGLVEKGQGLPPDADVIAARLARAGYRTAAFTTNPWLKRAFGFDRGFQSYLDIDRLGLERRLLGVGLKNWVLRRAGRIRVEPELVPEASEVTRRALDWLGRNGAAPFFLYLHYMDVHSPYDAVAPFHGALCSGHRLDLPDHLLEVQFRRGRFRGDQAVLEHVLELYDEEILATDAAIGRLTEGIARLGLEASTLLVVTADHGEEFLDHGGVMHGQTLYEEVVHVPLIVRPPGREASPHLVVPDRVSTLDLYPTLLELAGLPPRKEAAGHSLTRWLRAGETPPGPRVVGSQLFRNGFASTALYLDGDKFIRRMRIAESPKAGTSPAGKDGGGAGAVEGAGPGGEDEPVTFELYHLEADARERINAAGMESATVKAFAGLVESYEKLWGIPGAGAARGTEKLDPATLEQLRALGYID